MVGYSRRGLFGLVAGAIVAAKMPVPVRRRSGGLFDPMCGLDELHRQYTRGAALTLDKFTFYYIDPTICLILG